MTQFSTGLGKLLTPDSAFFVLPLLSKFYFYDLADEKQSPIAAIQFKMFGIGFWFLG